VLRGSVSKFCTSSFQVREARTYLVNTIVACIAIVSRFLSLSAPVNACDVWFYCLDMNVWLL